MIAKAEAKSPRHSIFAPGARVVVRDEEWLVRATDGTSTGGVAVRVIGLSELVRGKEAIFLTELDDVKELRPEETQLVRDESPRYRRSKLYLESLLRRTPPTDARLHVGARAAMRHAPYQLEPAHEALAQPRPRILIADGVGLGKTLEVGVLLSELIQRGRGERILVVGLKSILGQLQQELWARFTIPLVRLDSVGIQRVRANLPSNVNPFYHFPKVIISIDTLKNDTKYRAYLEDCHWDVIVIDEAQHVALRGSRSDRARLAQLLGRTSDALILTSATPHDGRPESFASLMNLLEPTAIADERDYSRDDIRGLFVRRFKRDVAAQTSEAFHERKVTIERVATSPVEEEALVAIARAEFRTIDAKRSSTGSGILFRTLLVKALLSSPAACASTIRARVRRIEAATHLDPKAKAHDLQILGGILTHLDGLSPEDHTKIGRLDELLRGFGYGKARRGDRVVIFSERIDTLKLLRDHLTSAFGLADDEVALFHGTLDDQAQQKLVMAFGTADTKVKILLGSDAAAEGINLHFFCHRLIHFDIPWSLITLEQRNGRIDRFGQAKEPDIRYLLAVPSDPSLRGDLRVLERLIEKEHEAHKNIGDAAFLMKQYEAEREEVQVARAIEGEVRPEDVLPDAGAAIAEDPLFALLMGSGPSAPKADLVATPLSLYPGDLDFAREALTELVESSPAPIEPPEWHEHVEGFTFTPPEDLQIRYRTLPRELRHADEIKLTVDRARVEKALEAARESEDKFPEWELFWPLHPVATWLHDRVLAHFARHEAPVIELGGLAPREVCMLFQGIYSNRRSQPLLVEWFAVDFELGAKSARIEPFGELALRLGLGAVLSNPKARRRAYDEVAAAIPFALEHARAHLGKKREARQAALVPELKDQERRLRAWAEKKHAQLDAREAEAEARPGGLRSHEKKRIDADRQEIDRRKAERKRWLEQSLETVDPPYLRLAAVFLAREGK